MPRIPRNPGSGKAPFNGPARGAGSGDWATGQASGGLRRFTSAEAKLAVAKRDDPAAQEWRAERRAEMLGVLHEVALTGQGAERVTAADKFLDRLDGKPAQHTDVTSGGERLGYVIAAPLESSNAGEWLATHKPK